MKRIIAVLLVLSLVFIMGCASGTTTAPEKKAPAMKAPTAPAQVDNSGASAEADLSDVEADLAEIDSLDEDLDMSDLDSLDAELNFEI